MTDSLRVIERIILILLLAFLLLLPHSIYLAQTAVHVAMIFWLVKIFIVPLKENIWLKTPIDKPFFFFLVALGAAFLSHALLDSPWDSLRPVRSYRHILITFLIVNNVRSQSELILLVRGLAVIALVHAAGIFYRNGMSLWILRDTGSGSLPESVFFWYVSLLSAFLFLHVRGLGSRLFYGAAALASLWALYFHHKVEVWFAWAVSLMVIGCFHHARKRFFIAALGAFVILSASYIYQTRPERFSLVNDGIEIVRDNPLGFIIHTKNLLKNLGYPDSINHFHNDIFQTAVTSGVVGVVALVWFLFAYLFKINDYLRSNGLTDFEKALLASGRVALIGLLGLILLESPLELSKNMMYIFFFTGLALTVICKNERLRKTDKYMAA